MKLNRLIAVSIVGFSLLTTSTSAFACDPGSSHSWSFFGWCSHDDKDKDHKDCDHDRDHDRDHNGGHDCNHGGSSSGSGSGSSTGNSTGSGNTGSGSGSGSGASCGPKGCS